MKARLAAIWLVCGCAFSAVAVGQAPSYRPEVVAKADQVLGEVGLKRQGKLITPLELPEIQRAIQGLAKPRRSIRGLSEAKQQTEDQLAMIATELRSWDAQFAELNLRLAQPGLDVLTNNRLTGLINANQVKKQQMLEWQESLKSTLTRQKQELADAEAAYAEVVLAARADLDRLSERLAKDLSHPQLVIALQVCAANFQTPDSLNVETLVGATDRKLAQLEQEVFRASIPLETAAIGALQVDVVINDQNVPMILDSGASIILLPADLASRLKVVIPADAPSVRLVQADGSTLSARGVTLPKVRVGDFVAENVAAAVLEDSALKAQPLLGMSFLSQFKFEIDAGGRKLNLVRVGD